MNKKLKITFAPGAFDSFEGTQEELDELIKSLEDGDLLENSEPVDLDELERSDPELAEHLRSLLTKEIKTSRKLN